MIEEKRYTVECYGNSEYSTAPKLAIFDIDRSMAEFIIRMARFVKENKCYKIERYDYSAYFFETDPRNDLGDKEQARIETDPKLFVLNDHSDKCIRTDSDRLSITDDDFQFLTYRKFHDEEIATEAQSVAELAAYFEIPWDFGGPMNYLQAKFTDSGSCTETVIA